MHQPGTRAWIRVVVQHPNEIFSNGSRAVLGGLRIPGGVDIGTLIPSSESYSLPHPESKVLGVLEFDRVPELLGLDVLDVVR